MQVLPVFCFLDAILGPFYTLFGWIMSHMYDWLGNYGLVIIVFNLILRMLIMPLSFKASKATLRQQFLTDDINEIKRVYAHDPRKAQEVQMDLMKQSGTSMTSGCLPMLLQTLVLFSIWRPVQAPLQYLGRVLPETIQKIAEYLVGQNLLNEKVLKSLGASDVPVLSALRDNANALGTAVNNGWIQLKQVLDLDFLGMDLGLTPTWKPALVFGADTYKTYLPLCILVVVMLLTMIASIALNKLNAPAKKSKEELEREKNNPAKAGQTPQQSEGMLKTMNYIFPIMMIFMGFTLPAAMTLYWLTNNVIAIIQTLLQYQLYTKPMKAMLAEAEASNQAMRRRKK